MNSFALLCSGQGGQTPDLFERFPFAEKGKSVKQQVSASGCLSPEVVSGLAVERAAEIAARHEGYVAIIIRNDHCLLGCLTEKAEALASAAAMSARRAVILNVTIASHTPTRFRRGAIPGGVAGP